MSDPGRPRPDEKQDSDEAPSKGPNLTLLYSLIVLAMIVATVIAAYIVLPFYQRR